MASTVDWKSLIDPSKGPRRGKKSSETPFLRIESGKDYQVRPVGGAVIFAKMFIKTSTGNKSAIVDMADREKLAYAVSARLNQKKWPSERYAMNVLDRADGKVKILEGGKQIFNHFSVWSSKNKDLPPGGKDAIDWTICATGEGLDKQYSMFGGERTTLTADEVALVKETIHDLNKFYKGATVEEAMQTLFGDSAETEAAGDGEGDELVAASSGSSNKSKGNIDPALDF